MPNDPITSVLLTMPLTLPEEPIDPAEIEESLAYADERHEIVEALHVPAGMSPTDFAEFCRDVLDAVLETAGFVITSNAEPASIGDMHNDSLTTLIAHMTAEDLVTISRGGNLPKEHPFLRAIRGEAA
jgi:hypothetical protein